MKKETRQQTEDILLWNRRCWPLQGVLNPRTGSFRRKISFDRHMSYQGWYIKRHGHYFMLYAYGDRVYLRIHREVHPVESVEVKWEKRDHTSWVQILVRGAEVYSEEYRSPTPGILARYYGDFDLWEEDFFYALYRVLQDREELYRTFVGRGLNP